ncbi:MAG TPA: hypothetical protein VK509_22450 [Polyangiales bacterium]|nr:hypothetical protein [Polyangiales bacterium]
MTERRGARVALVETLLSSDEPSIRWKTRVCALGEDPSTRALRALQDEIRASARVKTLLARRDSDGRITSGKSVYAKWQGAHWILATLADIGYPEGDRALHPARDQILDCWLAPQFYAEFEARRKADAYRHDGVPVMEGRHRRCASQQGYALFFLLKLGLENERVHDLVERLMRWRWPDGGWNCDKEPSAAKSTFIHTLHSMRGLALYAERMADKQARAAVNEASDIFLTRHLYKRASDGRVIRAEFTKLHYPLYWHYDVLGALKVMAEVRLIGDRRCDEALDLLESKEHPGGGWGAESRYYSVSKAIELHADFVDWGGASKKRMNPWVTVDALSVLRQAGRWKP